MIEAGFEVINPVQTLCHDMEAERLKKDFGNDVTFWGGGADTRSILNHGTPQQVKDDVKELIDLFGDTGALIIDGNQGIPDEAKPENVMALREAADEYGVF